MDKNNFIAAQQQQGTPAHLRQLMSSPSCVQVHLSTSRGSGYGLDSERLCSCDGAWATLNGHRHDHHVHSHGQPIDPMDLYMPLHQTDTEIRAPPPSPAGPPALATTIPTGQTRRGRRPSPPSFPMELSPLAASLLYPSADEASSVARTNPPVGFPPYVPFNLDEPMTACICHRPLIFDHPHIRVPHTRLPNMKEFMAKLEAARRRRSINMAYSVRHDHLVVPEGGRPESMLLAEEFHPPASPEFRPVSPTTGLDDPAEDQYAQSQYYPPQRPFFNHHHTNLPPSPPYSATASKVELSWHDTVLTKETGEKMKI
ncbi:uncharacterized protein HMPREF1120_08927 [Exophiala dermatitidis NIH/UT8656]|uniref:Uncharacterized protein n=1 Tax=Exophiala dermatitidis (strain ATCC 34100 / CBS 525.76 / NIH/UT8656) TaxID=858893 RepID=H6CB39_EXODN|nr:uncharacterized protein HMPREF1120_08927 [Exophiala dermatitidis NIH/UT8656]EHY60986.1 hypothetical protein HMPREF1120_08927 [Exophiala dermatitidis NIH/UT8656]